jgi:steroid Delta-isomerase
MTSSNAEHARRYYELVDADDLETMYTLFDDEVVYDRPGYEPLRGMEEFRAFYEGERVIEEGRHTLRTLVAEGDRVAVEGEFAGRLRDGSEVSLRFADFFAFRDGRIVRRDSYFHTPLV